MKTEKWPNRKEACYDCGSVIPGHHTPLCAMAGPKDSRDLPQVSDSCQWWVACRGPAGEFVPAAHRPETI